ncbi:MAG: hypothetical protein ACKOAD_09070, partial [Gammaproteobacteria bacterium]
MVDRFKFNLQKLKHKKNPKDYIKMRNYNFSDRIIQMDDRYRAILPEVKEDVTYRIQLKPIYAILLHPSFGSPAIVRPNGELSIYYLIHKDLQVSYEHLHDDDPVSTEDNSIFLKRFMLQTGIAPWADVAAHPSEHKVVSHISKSWMRQDEFPGQLFCTAPKAVDLTQPLFLKNAQGLITAKIEPLILKYYYDLGYTYWVRIDMDNNGLSKGLYNLTWNSLHPEEQKDASNYLLPHPLSVCKFFYEPQDEILMSALKDSGSEKKRSFNIPKTDDFEYAFGETKIESLHPVYVCDAPLLNTGHVTDIHISSQQHFFKKASKLQVLPGASIEDSPYIGDVVNTSFENIKSILDQMGQNP